MVTVSQVLAQVERSERGICGYMEDGRYFQVEREEDRDDFYIIVKAPCGSTEYDGWWPSDCSRKTMAEAIAEAIDGACLSEGEG